MPKIDDARERVLQSIVSLLDDKSIQITDSSTLIGDGSLLDSMRLVELCLSLEDLAFTLGFEFDWTSDTAMSRSRGMFRSVGALVAEFIRQMETSK